MKNRYLNNNCLRIVSLILILMSVKSLLVQASNPPSESYYKVQSKYFNFEDIFYSYKDSKNGMISKVGIDVSAHQGYIDWKSVKESGVDFAMIRLGYRGYRNGAIKLDDYLEMNFNNAREAGIDIGVYFYSQALNEEEAKEEAKFVLENLQGIELTYPIAYDFEFPNDPEARTRDIEWEQIAKNAAAFCKVIEEAHYIPMLYADSFTHFAYTEHDITKHYPIWYAKYSNTLDTDRLDMWQYTDKGRIPGIEANTVDLNIAFVKENVRNT